MSKSIDRVLVIREILVLLNMSRSQLCYNMGYIGTYPLVQFELNASVPFANKIAAILIEHSIPIPTIISEIQLLPEPSNSSSSSEEEIKKVQVHHIPTYSWVSCDGEKKYFRKANDFISINLIFHMKDTIKAKETFKKLCPKAELKSKSLIPSVFSSKPNVHVIICSGTGRVPIELNSLFKKLSDKAETELVVLFLKFSSGSGHYMDTFSRFYGNKFLIVRLARSHELETPSQLIPFISACKHGLPFSKFSQLSVLDLPNDFQEKELHFNYPLFINEGEFPPPFMHKLVF